MLRKTVARLSPRTVDTLIIGGGVMGLSSAYHLSNLRKDTPPSIMVVETDPSLQYNSALLSAGGIRQQFSLTENVEMSLYGSEFVKSHREELQFVEGGYIFLSDSASGTDALHKNLQAQRDAGCTTTSVISGEELGKIHGEWMRTSDIDAAGYSSGGEGWFDPASLIGVYKRGAVTENKCDYVHGEVLGVEWDKKKISSVTIHDKQANTTEVVHVNNVVNAAGASANSVMKVINPPNYIERFFPVRPRKRCIFYFKCGAEGGGPAAPMVIEKNGVYFRTEGENYICGVSPTDDDDPDVEDFKELERIDFRLFEDVIWPTIYNRVELFGNIKVASSWAGLYEYNTWDQNALIGKAPNCGNLFLINGFSGHGLQQSAAAGRGLAELIEYGEWQTVDLSIFDTARVANGVKVLERGIV